MNCCLIQNHWRVARKVFLAYKYVVEFYFAFFLLFCLSPHSFHLSKVLALKMISLIICSFLSFYSWPIVIYLPLWAFFLKQFSSPTKSLLTSWFNTCICYLSNKNLCFFFFRPFFLCFYVVFLAYKTLFFGQDNKLSWLSK